MNIIKIYHEDEIPKKFTGQVEFISGDVWILKNGFFHKEDGPAFISRYGGKEWYKEGKYHRFDGPAYEGVNGTKFWYIEGKECFPSEIMDYFKQFLILEKEKGNDGLIWLKFLSDQGIQELPFIPGMEEYVASKYLKIIK
jgi:hypothetical protein